MSAEAPIHSTGRGGAGNVGPDTTQYTDGGIVREGIQGESADGEYSSGRGGAGNIVDAAGGRASTDVVPKESEVKPQEDFHTGRGGGGNIHKEKYGGHTKDPKRLSFIDKVKSFIKGKKEEKTEAKPAETTTPAATT